MEHAKYNGLHPTKTSKSYHPTLKQEDEQLNGLFLLPVKLQAFEKSLSLKNFVDCTNKLFQQKYSSSSDSDVIEDNEDTKESNSKCKKSVDPDILKSHLYNLQTIGDEREWLKDILLESSEDEDNEISDFDFKQMLKIHAKSKKCEKQLSNDTREQYAFYGSSLLLEQDKYYEHHKRKPPPVDNTKSKTKNTKTVSAKEKSKNKAEAKALKQKIQHEKDIAYKRKKLWILIAKKEIPKANKARLNAKGTVLQSLKKLAVSCQRERRKEALRSQKISKDSIPRARRMSREMLLYWRRFDRVEKEHRKKAEKEAMEQRRQDEEMREMKRQQRKLNFLITQTELYAHFMGKKMKGQHESAMQNDILKKLDEPSSTSTRQVIGGVLVNNNTEQYDSDSLKTQALLNVQTAVLKQKQKASTFEDSEKKSAMMNKFDGSFSLSETSTKENLPQPKIFEGKLKAYQLKGMNWLVSLYEKGINGILADEMGLGKTVQSISFLSYLAETHNIWGPFLVVAPASTLHNWQQEFSKFLPRFKVLPYWGDPSDRKSLRKFWNQSSYVVNSKENAPFHVLITSYQLIVQDVKYFQRIKWQYLVLDEAQAIKSSSSIRWKILLGYNCRNRLLLTGTPIQNTMAELWALLHFIMPTLFDSHEEFNEWFSKDIEGAATDKKPSLNQDQLSRLHMILKPFMLRRIKKDVENELSEKIEINVMCNMSNRQKELYQSVKNKIVIEDILTSATTPAETKTSSLLMNLVMQFRKVCNHPDLFERKEAVRGVNVHPSPLLLPKLIYRDGLLNRSKLHSMSARNLDIWTENHIHTSMRENGNCFDFAIFTDLSPKECANLFKSIVQRLLFIIRAYDQQQRIQHACRLRSSKSHLLNRKDLYICTPYVSEKFQLTATISSFNRMKPCNGNLLIRDEISETAKFQRLEYPNFLTTVYPKACVRPVEVYCSDASYCNQRMESPELIRLLQSGVNEDRSHMLFPPPLQGLDAARPHNGWSLVKVPDCSTLTTDSGKLTVLDQLLSRLKKDNHRVLIYSQMTKMIDILEDFMRFRKHSFMRLDGSSKISDRRDMVSDFQSRDDIFAFLLSTRAGGLGINLTAADTVIFYDSDWNPTVDQQAMDRAHRLGQKKQVTVYRLVTKGTVEEKILIRAREKSEIQNIIISGGQFSKETLKPKEVASLLLDDVELASKLKQRRQERKVDEKQKPGRKRKADTSNTVSEKKRSIVENGVSDIDETSMSSLDLEYESTSDSHRPPTPTRGRGRGRGKPKAGSLAKAAASAAAMAGAAAGSAKAYAAYGYSFQKTT